VKAKTNRRDILVIVRAESYCSIIISGIMPDVFLSKWQELNSIIEKL
jgi:hypothetical protein